MLICFQFVIFILHRRPLGHIIPCQLMANGGILKGAPVNAHYNQMIYDQTVLGMDYLDGSNLTLTRNAFKN